MVRCPVRRVLFTLFVFVILISLLAVPISNVFAQEHLDIIDDISYITFPEYADTDYEKLKCIYSLLEEVRLEHNRQGAIARTDWNEYDEKTTSTLLLSGIICRN